ncbi:MULTISPECIES: ExeA family protein [Brachyspira]|uniref:ExeA family protein n=1 Tax=Brachyspira TaxID=29521 RepID=UPI0012F48BFF|nr:AAA family ATPase [Brachyspira murdochii]
MAINIKAFRKFGFKHDPFFGDIEKMEDVYLNGDMRFMTEFICQTAKQGGMVALIGESGSGKTTLRRYAIDTMEKENQRVKIIQCKIIDKTRLSVGAICDSIILDVSSESPKKSLEAKARQVERILTNSSRMGFAHVLIIEEAHDLSIATLKYLKRFWELEDGLKKLLSILLIGQTELAGKLDESKNYEAREIIRRMELLKIEPLSDPKDIKTYLQLKFAKAGVNIDDIITDKGIEAISSKLSSKLLRRLSACGEGTTISKAYPLSINNLMRRAINKAYDLKINKIDEHLIMSL